MNNMKKAFELTMQKGRTLPIFYASHISLEEVEKVQNCKKFKDYIERIRNSHHELTVQKIEIQSVELFRGGNVGFVMLKVFEDNQETHVFLRGHSVAILLFANQKLVLVQQYRVPAQRTFLQAPAGMLDEDGDFIGKAAQEIEEETGIKISKEILVPIGSYYPLSDCSDEEMFLYYCHVELSPEKIEQISTKIHGQQNSNEHIKVKFIDYQSNIGLQQRGSGLIALISAYQCLFPSK